MDGFLFNVPASADQFKNFRRGFYQQFAALGENIFCGMGRYGLFSQLATFRVV